MSKKKSMFKPILAAAMLIVAAATAAAMKWSGGDDQAADVPTFEVKRGPLTISIDASGTIKALDQEVITCKVKGEGGREGGGVTILTLVPEGTRVKKGDLLIELDSSSFEDQLVAEQITLQTAETTLTSGQENLAVGKSQAESDKEQAQLTEIQGGRLSERADRCRITDCCRTRSRTAGGGQVYVVAAIIRREVYFGNRTEGRRAGIEQIQPGGKACQEQAAAAQGIYI
jgi:multidrug efflux pump subunit AcrA (membrane-fusion protein)